MLLVVQHPACEKLEWWDAGIVSCLNRGAFAYGPADATAAHCLALVNPDWFYFSAHLGSPRQSTIKQVLLLLLLTR